MNGFVIAGIVVIVVGLIAWIAGLLLEETEWENLVPFSWLVIFCGVIVGGVGVGKTVSNNEALKDTQVEQALKSTFPGLKAISVMEGGSRFSYHVGSREAFVVCEASVKLARGKPIIQDPHPEQNWLTTSEPPSVCEQELLATPKN